MTKQDYYIFQRLFNTKDINKCPRFKLFLQGKLEMDIEDELVVHRAVESVMQHFCTAADKAALEKVLDNS